jgi:N-acetyltransferase 10
VEEVGKVVIRINIFKDHRQTIQYIVPSDHLKLAQAELVAIDEAAAIPLPTVKQLMGPYLVFLSSTINGYEGTGRSLSLKLLQQLRQAQGAAAVAAASQAASTIQGAKQAGKKAERQVHEERWKVAAEAAAAYGSHRGSRTLTELKLETPIRYGVNDPIEKWLNNLLCLDVASHSTRMISVMPAPKDCELYIVDRDALFSYHALSESLLQRIWALYTAAHYKNSPNDLQMLSDAPAHRLFVLLGPQTSSSSSSGLPDILCVVQIAFEGFISQKSIQSEMLKSNKASGDMIPWTVSQQFNDHEFASLSGARIVRIATHPDVQSMGYGSRAIELLMKYFHGDLNGKILEKVGEFGGEGGSSSSSSSKQQAEPDLADSSVLQEEEIKPRKKLPPLLTPLVDRAAERLQWIGVSFGLTNQLLSFWSRHGFQVCYVRQTANDLTGEHSCIVLHELSIPQSLNESPAAGWLRSFVDDYRRRLIALMSYSFHHFDAGLALTLLDPEKSLTSTATAGAIAEAVTAVVEQSSLSQPLTAQELVSVHMSHHDLQRLELYERNMVDHHMILDLIPQLASFVFNHRLPTLRFSYLQIAILLAIGLQHRNVDEIAQQLDLPVNQVLAFFNKTVRKLSSTLRQLVEAYTVASEMKPKKRIGGGTMVKTAAAMTMHPISLAADQREDELDFKEQQKQLLVAHKDLSKHVIDVDEEVLGSALQSSWKRTAASSSDGVLISVAKQRDSSASDGQKQTAASTPKSHKKDKHRPRDVDGSQEKKKKQKHMDG